MHTKYEFIDGTNQLMVRTRDDYNSLPQKVMAAFFAVLQRFHFKYIFKTDDDQNCLLETPKLFFCNLMQTLSSSSSAVKWHYGGNIVHVKKDHISTYHKKHPELPADILIRAIQYCSGRFYFLSHSAVVYLLEFERKQIEGMFLEDYAIGLCLHAHYKQMMIHLNSDVVFGDFTYYSSLTESSTDHHGTVVPVVKEEGGGGGGGGGGGNGGGKGCGGARLRNIVWMRNGIRVFVSAAALPVSICAVGAFSLWVLRIWHVSSS